MKPDLLVMGVVIVVWLQDDDPLGRPGVQELAGPRSSAPVPLAPPAPALPPASEPGAATLLFEFDRAVLREAEAGKIEKRNIDPAAVRTSAKGELGPASGDACMGMGPELRKNTGLVACLQPDRRVELTVSRGT